MLLKEQVRRLARAATAGERVTGRASVAIGPRVRAALLDHPHAREHAKAVRLGCESWFVTEAAEEHDLVSAGLTDSREAAKRTPRIRASRTQRRAEIAAEFFQGDVRAVAQFRR